MSDLGLRKAEALSLAAEDVNENNQTITVKGKGGKVRILPFTSDRLEDELLKTLDKRHSRPLSVNPKTGLPWYDIKKALSRAGVKAGLKQKLTHHLLRHTFLTLAAEKGVSPHALQQLAGHSDIRITNQVYTHVRKDFVRQEVEKLRG